MQGDSSINTIRIAPQFYWSVNKCDFVGFISPPTCDNHATSEMRFSLGIFIDVFNSSWDKFNCPLRLCSCLICVLSSFNTRNVNVFLIVTKPNQSKPSLSFTNYHKIHIELLASLESYRIQQSILLSYAASIEQYFISDLLLRQTSASKATFVTTDSRIHQLCLAIRRAFQVIRIIRNSWGNENKYHSS